LYAYLSQKATVTKYKLPDPPNPKFVYTTRVNLIYNLDNDQKLTLKKFDAQGKLIREYYKDKVVPTGLYVVTLGHNDMVEDTSQHIVFKLLDEVGQVLMTKTGKNNQLEDKPKVWLLKTTIEYEVKEPIPSASLKLYDPENNLVTVLYQNKNLVAGKRRSPYSFFHGFGKNAKFHVRLTDSKEVLLQEFGLDATNSSEVVR
ncbi:MAG: hypothetical protein K2Q22_16175, partial [Cytophagales bacterium]|nr:hypothetical protein [Cytophagales bacterium]